MENMDLTITNGCWGQCSKPKLCLTIDWLLSTALTDQCPLKGYLNFIQQKLLCMTLICDQVQAATLLIKMRRTRLKPPHTQTNKPNEETRLRIKSRTWFQWGSVWPLLPSPLPPEQPTRLRMWSPSSRPTRSWIPFAFSTRSRGIVDMMTWFHFVWEIWNAASINPIKKDGVVL